jgi:hypothetical protein
MAVKRKKSTRKQMQTSTDQMRSFRIYPANEPFLIIRINHQTFYWLVVSLLVLALGVWTVLMTTRVHAIYDEVTSSTIKEL